ncbi:hypothetical protein D9757_006769 [Collybiopsis confluens]|uniref:Uncharacterized protein n=1 Tax=Collybiopsis confluens TaxID=2823264 RepID=A0A8H5HLG6_9AGAR|nr:hypothetical protein D9757_006769 [Collybiopsis confluens]
MPATVKLEGIDVSAVPAIGYGHATGRGSTLVGRGPVSNATCLTGFGWADNAGNSTPCLVAAAVVGGCGNANYTVPLLKSGNSYHSPGGDGVPVNSCSCSWAAYNLYSACTACQGLSLSVLTYYPADTSTLDNTSIPFYATVLPTTWTNAIFNTTQAQDISEQGHPDVYGAPLTTPSAKSKSNGGAIGGGVAGGVIVLLIGATALWWILRKRGIALIRRKRNGKPQEIDSTTYNSNTGHARTWSDLTKTSHVGDSSFGNSSPSMGLSGGYIGTIGMQQAHPTGLAPSPFSSSSINMGSVSSSGIYTTPPHQSVIHVDGSGGGPPSMYNDRASTIISRYESPSPSMQFVNRSQSPDNNSYGTPFVVGGAGGGTVVTGGNDIMTIQPFVLPPISTSPPPGSLPPTKGRTQVGTVHEEGDNIISRMDSQESLNGTPPLSTPPFSRRMNPPPYAEVALSDSREVAANRRETHGTGHRPVLPEKQPSQASQTSQISQQSSQETSLWSDAPTSVGHGVGIAIGHGPGQGPTPDLAAIDAYVNQIGIRPGAGGGAVGAEATDTVPVLHTTAVPPGQTLLTRPSDGTGRRLTMNTTVDDGDHSVVGGHTREDDDGGIA